MAFFSPAPLPKSKLGFYRKLSTAAGVHVSPIALGGGNIGNKMKRFKLLDAYHDLGGNFIDTANAYPGAFRDQIFVATKYTNSPAIRDPNVAQKIQFSGNSLKSMHVDSILSYIDLFYVHWWDFTTSIPELMQALHGLVLSRKVLYLGISDAPAWVVTKANQYARDHALTQFSVYQGMWSILERSFERDIIPMARDEGIALAPWAVLAGGRFALTLRKRPSPVFGEKGAPTTVELNGSAPKTRSRSAGLLRRSQAKLGRRASAPFAIAYVLHKTTFVFPIIGGPLDIALTDEHLRFLDSVAPVGLGFPHNMILFSNNANGHPAYWPAAKPISPAK
ncbi:Aldo/keto reductase [Coprinellus micaceus]|uniref:Aldo/keto reductase n=1 Tax=Coprinellus micaceus TaxID=71717 RepID=A0A4Y7RC11_COPMI|nr:Aldo/keto reductase [Coprinellus micaceus]